MAMAREVAEPSDRRSGWSAMAVALMSGSTNQPVIRSMVTDANAVG